MSEVPMAPFYAALLLHDPTPRPGDWRRRKKNKPTLQWSVIAEFTKADYERYNDAYQTLNNLLNVNVFTYMRYTMFNLENAIQSDIDEMLSGRFAFGTQEEIVRVGIRMRSASLSFCSALHYHQEHTYKEVIGKHGDGSKQHKKIQRIFNRLFEKSPEYRLLYHTRNTMIHYTMDTITIDAGAAINRDKKKTAYSNPEVDISAIVDLNTEISDKYREELRAGPQRYSIQGLARTAFPLVDEANDRILRIMHTDLDIACKEVIEFDKLFDGKIGSRKITTERSTNDPPPLRFTNQSWSGNVIAFAYKFV
ncbi:hypothetical protein O1W68_16640 [Rhodococcus sp. H36-A4]|uniref:hypothetical protein n=1 Tax=Rhodococcus sp. H36-A4 TaxID=3004353 RepID=UPI0022AE6D2F|nr:hypothetical protein [Rhodococcus sp. H36-A4]MCZ4079578.1 hypothetical protein [Rhodococcus sp. H36-A4]